MFKHEIKWVLSKRQQMVVKAYIVAHYDKWVDEGRFNADWCCDDVVEFFGFKTHDEACDCQGLAEEVEDDKFRAEEYWWGVHLGFIKG